MDRGADVIAQGRWRRGMVWAAGCAAAGGEAEQAVDLVVRSGRHEAGARDEGNNDPAIVAVFGITGENSGTMPEFLWVVPPGEGYAGEKYPVLEYAAYYRQRAKALANGGGGGCG